MKNEEIFDVLRTKGKELSDWLKENFNPHTAIIITDTEVKIVDTVFYFPLKTVDWRVEKEPYNGDTSNDF